MRVSIIAADNTIMIDGVHHVCDTSVLIKEGISAVQWYGDHGEVEYVGHVKPNDAIESLHEYQEFVDHAEEYKPLLEAVVQREANPETRLGNFDVLPTTPPSTSKIEKR